jgi:hypothetical protein
MLPDDNRMKAITLLLGVLVTGAPLAAQLPPACTCNMTKDTNWGHANIGHSQTTTASCSTQNIGGSIFCQISGTVSFYYAPVNFTLAFAQFGDPAYYFTPTAGTNTYVHPIPTQVQCGQGSVSSYVVVVGKIGGTGPDISLEVYRTWSCDSY